MDSLHSACDHCIITFHLIETDIHVPASLVPLLPPVTKTEAKNQNLIATTSDAELYAELTPRLSRKATEDSLYYESATLVPSISGALESSALVTGALASPKNRKKPIPAPKPKAKLQERRQREAKVSSYHNCVLSNKANHTIISMDLISI